MAKLEDFIENYLKNKKISDYEGWLALYGRDGEREYRDALAAADNGYAAARAEYGKRGAALAEAGLTGGGYSDYLNHTAYATRAAGRQRAESQRAATREENERGYLSYLKSEADAEEKAAAEKKSKEEKIFGELLGKNLLDRDSAIVYLVSRGVERKRAEELADESIAVLRGSESYQNKLISEATSLKMDYETAYNYALVKGLSEEAARSVASIVSFKVKQEYQNNFYRY